MDFRVSHNVCLSANFWAEKYWKLLKQKIDSQQILDCAKNKTNPEKTEPEPHTNPNFYFKSTAEFSTTKKVKE